MTDKERIEKARKKAKEIFDHFDLTASENDKTWLTNTLLKFNSERIAELERGNKELELYWRSELELNAILQKENKELNNIIHGHQPLEQIFQLQKDKEELVKALRECVEVMKYSLGKELFPQGVCEADKETEAYRKVLNQTITAEGILNKNNNKEEAWK